MTSPSDPVPLLAGVDDVLITAELGSRPFRAPDYEAESRALGLLAHEMATNPQGVLQKCAELAMDLCHADSAGISVLEPGGTSGMFRWHAAAGAFAPHLHGTMPREASPCGTVMERDRVLLFTQAERVFPALRDVEPRIYENLLAPWHVKGEPVGTLWAIKHTPEGRFDAEDARVLQSLARSAAAAFQMISAIDAATVRQVELEQRTDALLEVEEQQSFLLTLSDAVRPLAGPADIQGETTLLLREHLNAGWCYYVEWDLDRKTGVVLRDSAREGLASLAGAHDVSDAPEFLRLLKAGEVLMVRDYAGYEPLPARIREQFVALGFRSMMVASLFKGDRLTASLLVGDTEIREWSASEVSLLLEIAERTWAAIERGRAESALRESEGRLHLALEATALAVYEWDLVTDRLMTNERFRELVGRPAGAPVIGANVMEYCVHRDDRAQVDPDLAGAMDPRGDGKFVFEHRLSRIEPLGHPWVLSHGQVYFGGPADARHPVRIFGTLQEITARKLAETALRESEEKYRNLYTEMGQGLIEVELIRGPDGDAVDYRYLVLNPAYERLTGIPIDKAVGRPSLEVIPGLSNFWAGKFQRIVESSRAEEFEYEEKALDRWFGIYAYPGDGDRLTVLALDITQRKKAEAALRESEERFQQFANASSGAIWIRNADTLAMEYVSPAIEKIYGLPQEAFLGDMSRWASLIVPEDRETALAHVEQARRGDPAVHEFRIQRPSDKAFRWIRNTDFPLYDAQGNIERVGGIAEDITDEKLSVEHQGVLLAELQHRVRNIMAILRSIAARTADSAGTVEEYAELIAGRLNTFARVQALLTRAVNVGVGLATIVEDELRALAAHGDQFDTHGPDVELSPKAAETMTLAVHELTTNALKYGALSVPNGKVMVRWEIVEKQDKQWLNFDWSESGAPQQPQTDKPRRVGFGSELIEGRIPYELNGRGKVTILDGGAQCHLEFPLQEGASILETGAPRRANVFGGAIDMTGQADLTGQRILVVEDDYYLASDTARALRGAGADVLGPCATEEDARSEIADRAPTCAVLDINLRGGRSFDLAGDFKRDGVPFVFITGYDQEVIPERFEGVTRLQKPVEFRHVIHALAETLNIPS